MIHIVIPDHELEIYPITENELDDVLAVYEQCEDFLSLGPVSKASMEMVLSDLEISRREGCHFCGIYQEGGEMIGIIDFVPHHYQGDPSLAFLNLLMIAAPFREQGVGTAVVDAVEKEIRKDHAVRTILSGVQVNNPFAIRFWQHNGYRICSEPKLYPDQTTAVDLRKDWE